MTEEKKSERLVARITAEDKATIERAAELEGRSLSSFTVQHLLSHARTIIEDQELIRLNEDESRRLVGLLTNPPSKASPVFKEALQNYRETVVSDANQSDSAK